MQLSSQRAIRDPIEDLLGHRDVAELVLEAIACSRSASAVALLGPSGSGKTGVVNLAGVRAAQFGLRLVIANGWRVAGPGSAAVLAEEIAEKLRPGMGGLLVRRQLRSLALGERATETGVAARTRPAPTPADPPPPPAAALPVAPIVPAADPASPIVERSPATADAGAAIRAVHEQALPEPAAKTDAPIPGVDFLARNLGPAVFAFALIGLAIGVMGREAPAAVALGALAGAIFPLVAVWLGAALTTMQATAASLRSSSTVLRQTAAAVRDAASSVQSTASSARDTAVSSRETGALIRDTASSLVTVAKLARTPEPAPTPTPPAPPAETIVIALPPDSLAVERAFRGAFQDGVPPTAAKTIAGSPQRTVVVLDDLDRCPPAVLAESLGMLRTTLELKDVLFLVPLDEASVVQAWESAHLPGTGLDALAKIFDVCVRMPVASLEQRAEFLEKAAAVRQISNTDAVRVLKLGVARTPRVVKRTLDRYEMLRFLAAARSDAQLLVPPFGDGDQATLAVLAVLAERWPVTYAAVEADPSELGRQIQSAGKEDLTTPIDETKEPERHRLRELRLFLRRATGVRPQRVAALIHMQATRPVSSVASSAAPPAR